LEGNIIVLEIFQKIYKQKYTIKKSETWERKKYKGSSRAKSE